MLRYLSLLLCVLHPALAEAQQRFLVDDYPGENDRECINAALTAMRTIDGPKELHFSERHYEVEPADRDTFEPVLGVDGLRELAIHGNGATIVAKNALDCSKGYFFRIRQFEKLSLRGLTFVHDPLPFIQGQLLEVDQASNRCVVELETGFDHIEHLRLTPNSEFWCRIGLSENPQLPKADNPSWLGVKPAKSGALSEKRAGERQWELAAGYFDREATHEGEFNWKVGQPIVVWKRGAQDMLCFEDGKQLKLEEITVHTALHYAIKLRGVHAASIRNCNVIPVEGGMLSGSADGIDIQQSRDFEIDACRLIATGDDMISLLNHRHGYNGEHHEKKFSTAWPETNLTGKIHKNQLVGGNRNGVLGLCDDLVIIDNELSNIRQYGIKFSGNETAILANHLENIGTFTAWRHIHDEQNTGIICSDEWLQEEIIIGRNIIINWHHMPALTLKGVKDTLLIDNAFIQDDASLIFEKPINAYLKENKVLVLMSGEYDEAYYDSDDFKAGENIVYAPGGWADSDALVFVDGEQGVQEMEFTLSKERPVPSEFRQLE